MTAEMNSEGKRFRSSPGLNDGDTNVDQIVKDFKQIKNPDITQLSAFLVTFLEATNNLNSRTTVVEEKVRQVEEKCEKQGQQIAKNTKDITEIQETHEAYKEEIEENLDDLRLSIENLKSQVDQNSTQINFSQQLAMDNDVILKGFTAKPSVDLVIPNFVALFGLEANQIRESYYVSYERVETKNFSNTKKLQHFVVISFKSKATKIKVFKKKVDNGPILQNQLHPDLHLTENPVIKCTNKLTKFNLYSQRILYKASTSKPKVISDYRYHNCLFQIKFNGKADWLRVDTYKKVHEIHKLIPAPDSHTNQNESSSSNQDQ